MGFYKPKEAKAADPITLVVVAAAAAICGAIEGLTIYLNERDEAGKQPIVEGLCDAVTIGAAHGLAIWLLSTLIALGALKLGGEAVLVAAAGKLGITVPVLTNILHIIKSGAEGICSALEIMHSENPAGWYETVLAIESRIAGAFPCVETILDQTICTKFDAFGLRYACNEFLKEKFTI